MKTLKKLIPGQPGTKKLFKEFGEKLFCVRYRDDSKRQRKIKTVELIIEEDTWKTNSHKIPGNKLVHIHIAYKETHLRKLVKEAGGRWDGEKKLWEMPYKEVIQCSQSGSKSRCVYLNKWRKKREWKTCGGKSTETQIRHAFSDHGKGT